MKKIFYCTILIIITLNSNGQKIALLNKDYTSPILFTDSITVEQTTSGYFPIEVKNIDTFYSSLSFIQEMLRKRQRAKMESFSFIAGSTNLNVHRVPFAYGDRYQVNANSKVNGIEVNKTIVDALKRNNNQSAEDLEKLKKYIASNKKLFKSPNEFTPVISNIVTITGH